MAAVVADRARYDELMALSTEKKRLSRAEKKELKKLRKALIKEAKKNKTYNPEDWEDDEEGGLGLILLAAFFILLVWLAIFAILIHMDVGGLGSSIMYPILKDVPYVNQILPEVEVPPTDSAYTFQTMDEAIARIQELEQQLAQSQSSGDESGSRIAELEALVTTLQPYKDNVDAFNAERQKFYQEVVFSDQAPDINEYRSYYESIDPANAELLYKQVVIQQEKESAVSDYAAAYSSMEPAQAAAIFDDMTDNFILVAKILKAMNAEERGAILAAMDTANAAALTKIMEP